ncbi:MAG: UDP-N-acetylglucosamine 2-epimerase (non-hydrolyzing) [Verrucomicrobia bacterium]|nr:UDP-N-acetylglucosamine 2-epimerase (non-hydrolyzing) [Verrucomicrobiota bacterium]
MLKIMHIVGARPNFPKVAPIMSEMARRPEQFQQVLVHTGQHYDYNMSQVFFEQLEIPTPDEFLNVGSGSHAAQTAAVMTAFEPVLAKHRPDWVMVVGDVNSTLACALVCSKLGVRIAHVEAGLRSGDRTMPEEINRLLTDQISDLLFTPSKDGNANLLREGVESQKIHCVGNVMIDTLVKLLPKAQQRPILSRLGLEPREHVLVTLHRPSNVDDAGALREILQAMAEISRRRSVVFPVHPRTRKQIVGLAMALPNTTLRLIEPLGYLDFLALMNTAALVITDSGGVQEETTYLGIPCLTVRPNTERPITLTSGTNRLVASRCARIVEAAAESLRGSKSSPPRPEYWDGQTAGRIADVMMGL